MSTSKFFMAAGGTGGHIIPALRIAKRLQSQLGAEISFLGGKKGMESVIVPEWGFEIMTLPILPMPRKPGMDMLRFPFNLGRAVLAARKYLKKERPDAVVSTGGFASGPYSIAAGLLGIPLFLQEQNSYPGITQRWASLWAEKIYYAFPGSERRFLKSTRAIMTGNPIDLTSNTRSRDEVLAELGLSLANRTVLITGGSQGSLSINNAVSQFAGNMGHINVIWQTGKNHYERITGEIAETKTLAIRPFIPDMASTYLASDLIVARAGALTLSEIAAFGKPSILIPFPYAAANHQYHNAKVFENNGAALLLEDSHLELLAGRMKEIVGDIARLKKMGDSARTLGRPAALDEIVNDMSSYFDTGNAA